MEIYIDGLFYKGAGIGRYYESLTKELTKRGIKIITSVPERLRDEFEKDFADIAYIEPIFVDYEKFSLKGYWQPSNILKKLENKIDLFFYPHINMPYYIPKKTIVTIHDLIPFTAYWDRSKMKFKIFQYFLNRSIKYSQFIVCISNTVKNELISFNKKIDKKAYVIYEFIDDKFININKFNKALLTEPYLLFVGNRKKHKNLCMLIKAFNNIKNFIPHKLVIAGAKDSKFDEVDDLKENLNLSARIVEFISPDDDTIINLYQHADLFVFPSLFEGFGLPPLEAVALGCPVILSDIPILREIFEDAAIYFNPLSEHDIAAKIINILQNNNLREKLILMEKKRLQFFNKDLIINQHIELFEKAIREAK